MKRLMNEDNERLSVLLSNAIMSYERFIAELINYKLTVSAKKAELGEADSEDNVFIKVQKALQKCLTDFDNVQSAIDYASKNNDMYQLATLRLPQHIEAYTEKANDGAKCCNKLSNVENENIQDFREDLVDLTEMVRHLRDDMNDLCETYAEHIPVEDIDIEN